MTTRAAARANLVNAVRRVVDALEVKTLAAFDPNDPGAKVKAQFMRKFAALIQRRFDRQAGMVEAKIQAYYPGHPLKAAPTQLGLWDDPDLWDDLELADMVMVMHDAALSGIDIFKSEIGVGIDYTLVNKGAVDWARKYAGQLVKEIDSTTREVIQSSVAAFANTPGMTLADAMAMMPFDTERAQRIAITETTRAYATANILAGQQLKAENPDLKVTKTWFTNNDDRVCDICGPLDGKEVEIDESFDGENDQPPAHPNCRCWTSTGTRILDS